MEQKIVKIGLVGFGTVGTGLAKLIIEDGDQIASKTGLRLELACVVDADTNRPRAVRIGPGLLTNDLNRLLNDPQIQIAVELVGGIDQAKQIQARMLEAGKDVVTANKALLATCGTELFELARSKGRCIAFEASCAGGVPIISALRTGLVANQIRGIYGIVNGTCNYILSCMSADGLDFGQALAQAKAKGYAEADPTLDISGQDSAHKLAILASLAFGCDVRLEDIYVEGIQMISHAEIAYGAEMGYVLKLLAIGQRAEDGRISLKVHPSFIHKDCPLARVSGPFNAISVFGHATGQVIFYGRGAGMMPTASAVVSDIIDVALGNSQRTFDHLRIRPRTEVVGLITPIHQQTSRFYVRTMAKDQPGVFAALGQILAKHQISISGALQHEGTGPDNTVPVVIVTHTTTERQMAAALEDIARLDVISGRPVCIRIIDIPEDNDS